MLPSLLRTNEGEAYGKDERRDRITGREEKIYEKVLFEIPGDGFSPLRSSGRIGAGDFPKNQRAWMFECKS